MIARFNSYREFETPMLYVCAPGCKYVDGMLTNTSGILTDVSDIEIIPTFNATSELNFRCYRVHREDAEENSHFYSLFRSLRNRRMIYVEDIGFFVITNVEDGYDLNIGTDYKDISCESCEEELRSKNIPYIEDGTYKFFTGEEGNPGMLETLVQSTPLWYIGDVDTEVANRYRTFEDIDFTDNVLGFMLEDLQNAYECIFVFDIQNRIINVYDQANYVHETNIHLTRDDLITSISVSESSDDLYTALSVTGEDDLSINAVNPLGTNVIYNFDYYLDWMTPSLRAKVEEWQDLVTSYSDQYYNLQMARYSGLTSLSTLNAEYDQLNTQLTMYKRCRENMVAQASDEQIAEYNAVITSVGGTPIPEDKGYLWIMFGDDASGTNITTNPYGKRYIGLAWDKGTNVASNSASDYTWFTFRSGESFPRQKNGTTLYTWIVFADSVTSGMSNEPEDVASSSAKPYIGISVDNSSSQKSSTYDDYTWSLTNVGGISVSEALGTIDELVKQTEAAITAKAAEIAEGDEYIDTSEASVINIQNAVSMQNFFTEEELEELSNYIVEGSYSDDYIGITDIMSYNEIFEQMKTLYDRAVAQLKTVSVPTQQFTIDVENFIFVKEFEQWSDQLETGCLINVELMEGDVAQLFLTSFEVNYEDKKLSMTFGNRYNRFDSKALFDKFLGNVSKTQNTLSYIRSTIYPIKNGEFNQMKEALETSRTLTKNAALSSTNEQVTIDDTGYTGRRVLPDGTIDPHQIKINGRNIVFTDDAWETCKTAIGEIILGSGESKYGINAEIILGNMIYGNELHIIDKDGKDMFQVTEDKIMLSVGDIYAEKEDTISGVDVMYCRASSSTACNISTMTTPWSTAAPGWVDGEYIWQKTVTTYDDGHTSESAATCLTGATGQSGKGIASTVIKYARSTDGVNHPTNESEWYDDIPDYVEGDFVWTRTVITYTDNSTSTSYSVGRNGVNGDHNAVVYLYKRSPSQVSIDWTTQVAYDFQLHTLAPVPSGWSTTIPTGVDTLYVTAATASSNTQTDIIEYTEWSSPVAMARSGANTATVFLYKRSADVPEIPTTELTYTFADGSLDLSPLSITGHTVVANDSTVENLFYVNNEVLRLTSAITGTGYTYQWYYKTPSSSSYSAATSTSATAPTYTITAQSRHDGYQYYCRVTDTYGNSTSTRVVRINLGKWSQHIPASDGNPCYVIQATAIGLDATDDITGAEWSTVTELVTDGVGISGTSITYVTSTNGSTPPAATADWSTTFPGELEEGEYLWTKTVTTYTDGTDSTVYSVSRNGVMGQDGEAGRGITHVSNRYAVSTSSSTAPDVWVDSPPTLTATNKYLWNYEIITYTDNTSDETERRIIGVYGDQGVTGNGINKITEYYLASASDSGVTTSTSGWTTTVQAVTGAKKYLWNYEVVEYTNGNSFTSTPAIIGMFSNSIVSSSVVYTTSDNGTNVPTSGWQNSVPSVAAGRYLWTRTTTNYAYGDPTVSYSVSRSATNGNHTAVVYLYKRSSSAATINWTNNLTYNFTTNSLTSVPSGWSATVPTGTDPIYMTAATASSNGDTDTIAYTEFATPVMIAQNGSNGSDGADGSNSATIFLYQRAASSSSLSKPTATLTYTFSTGTLTGTLGNWSQAIPANDGNPCFVIQATAVSTGATDTISSSEWSSIRELVANGEDGVGVSGTEIAYATSTSGTTPPSSGWGSSVPTVSEGQYLWTRTTTNYTNSEHSTSYSVSRNGMNGANGTNGKHSAVVYLYKRSATAATIDWNTDLPYSFTTNALTALPSGWSLSVPTGLNPIYVTAATVSSAADTATIPYTAWATPAMLAQNGEAGAAGSNGSDGLSTAIVFLYQRAANSGAITKPAVDLDYTFSTGVLSGNLNGWSQSIPSTDGNPCFVIQATAVGTGATDRILTTEWSDIAELVVDGDGVGVESAVIAYATSNDGTNPPTDDWSDIIPSDIGEKKFMWTRTTTNYTDGSQTVAYSVSSSGVGIAEIVTEYYLSTSNTELLAGEWSDTPPAWTSGTYIWTRSHLYWDNGDESTTTPVLDNSLNQINADIYDCQTDIEVNKQGIQQNTQYYQELYGQVAKINAYIQTGVIGVDETGKSSFGVKIGENLSTVGAYIINGSVAFSDGWLSSTDGGVPLSPDESVLYQVQTPGSYFGKTYRWNGSTYSEAESEGTLSSIFTSSELGFYDTGEKTAYFSNKNLNVTTVRTTRILFSPDVISDTSSNNWQIGIDNGFYLKWVGAADGSSSGGDTETDTASTFTATSPVTNNTDACTITITRAKNTYIHSLQYSTDGSNWTTITASTTGESAISWTPNLTFSGSATSISCTVRCITYKGSVAASNLVGSYDRIVVVNKEGQVVAPTITSHPSNVTAAPNTTVTYGVIANGSDLTYNWQFELSNVSGYVNMSGYTSVYTDCYSGYNTATLTITDTTYFNGVNFRCVVSNSAGSVISNSASLTIQETVTAPTITSHPSDASVQENVDALFSVTASGTSLSYQWQSASSSSGTFSNVTNLTGYNTASLTVPGTSTYNGYAFRCVVSNSAGSVTSNSATLDVQVAQAVPQITVQPQSTTVYTGEQVTFSLTATGDNLSYTWYMRTSYRVPWAEMGSGYKTASITLTAGDTNNAANGYQYRCTVSNSVASVNSDIVTLTVKTSRLPLGYHEVEYLESTAGGGQYIQTGITSFNSTDEIDIAFMYFAIPAAGNQNVISIAGTGDAQHYMRIPAINNNYNAYIISDSPSLISTPQANKRFDAVINNSSHKVLENNTDLGTLTSYTGDFWYSYQITLFGVSNTAGTLSGTGSRCRIYSFVHKNNSTNRYLRNYVPCYRTSDNEPGFYDLVNNTFIANAGDGTFVVGPEV